MIQLSYLEYPAKGSVFMLQGYLPSMLPSELTALFLFLLLLVLVIYLINAIAFYNLADATAFPPRGCPLYRF